MTATENRFQKGDRVVPTLTGRTRDCSGCIGTVKCRLSSTAVNVRWDGTSFDDEMEDSELRPVTEEAR